MSSPRAGRLISMCVTVCAIVLLDEEANAKDLGYDCGRNWRVDGRFVDAFVGYRQDETTRRSAHSLKIYIARTVLLHDMETRGYSKRLIRWLDSSIERLFSGNRHVLRHIRVE